MNIFKNYFLFKKKPENNKSLNNEVVDQYREIAKLVKEARIKKKLTIQELSRISKIPEQTINSIENNDKNIRPFLRSILIKLEECLVLKKNTLIKFAIQERSTIKREKKDFIIRKFDLLNNWQGSLLYFLILILSIFILKRYFILEVDIIEIQQIEDKFIKK